MGRVLEEMQRQRNIGSFRVLLEEVDGYVRQRWKRAAEEVIVSRQWRSVERQAPPPNPDAIAREVGSRLC